MGSEKLGFSSVTLQPYSLGLALGRLHVRLRRGSDALSSDKTPGYRVNSPGQASERTTLDDFPEDMAQSPPRGSALIGVAPWDAPGSEGWEERKQAALSHIFDLQKIIDNPAASDRQRSVAKEGIRNLQRRYWITDDDMRSSFTASEEGSSSTPAEAGPVNDAPNWPSPRK